jgi:hypothetical protein
VRVAIVAAVVLLCGSWNAPVGAIEFVTLRASCNYIGDNVVLIPSSQNRLHVVIGDREQKVIRTCAPGRAGKCRLWVIHRFDLLCGEKKVSWRSIAEQLLNLTPMPARMGNTSKREPLETWELRTLRAESGFAPVDELGGRILSFADKSTPQPSALGHTSDMNAALAAEIAIRALLSPKFEPARVTSRVDLRKGADATQLFQSDLPKSTALISQQPSMPSSSIGPTIVGDRPVTAPDAPLQPIEEVAANISGVARANLPRQEVDSVSGVNVTNLQTAVRDSPSNATFTSPWWDDEQVGRFLIVLAFMFLLILAFPTIISTARVIVKRKPVTLGSYPTADGELHSEPETGAETCRELMKQVATELMRSSSAVNCLRGAPALQNALYRELDSIKRSLGFAPPAQGNSEEPEDWHRIKSRLLACLQEMQRVIAIAEAARASFSFPPAALQVITTRLEAYAFLGVNGGASELMLKKTVNALRECWHPDLATDEEDRHRREIRIKQINVAWDLISQKRMSA